MPRPTHERFATLFALCKGADDPYAYFGELWRAIARHGTADEIEALSELAEELADAEREVDNTSAFWH